MILFDNRIIETKIRIKKVNSAIPMRSVGGVLISLSYALIP